jgi:hypothetical protein
MQLSGIVLARTTGKIIVMDETRICEYEKTLKPCTGYWMRVNCIQQILKEKFIYEVDKTRILSKRDL